MNSFPRTTLRSALGAAARRLRPLRASLAIAVAACAPAAPQIVYQAKEVKVPIAVQCKEPPPFEMPDLPTDHIDMNSSDADTARAYEETKELLSGAVVDCVDILDGYRAPKPEASK